MKPDRVRVGCYCGWKGVRVIGGERNKPCPKCGRKSVKALKWLPARKKLVYIPMCMDCDFFRRNKGFPNRYGPCHRKAPGMVLNEVHDSFGCVGFMEGPHAYI